MAETHSFLRRFPAHQRGWLGNLFNLAVRDGASDVNAVLTSIRRKVNRYLQDPWLSNEREKLLQTFAAALDEPDAEQYVQYVLQYESLSNEERQRIKANRSENYKAEWMSLQPPSEKQLKYLRTLGCDIMPANSKEASHLIDEHIKLRSSERG